MASDRGGSIEERRNDLAAIAPPSSGMPRSFELGSGSYVPLDRVVHICGADMTLARGAVVGAYEANYSLYQGVEILDLQVIRFASRPNVDLNLAISNGVFDRFSPASEATDLPEPATFENAAARALVGVADDVLDNSGEALRVYSVAYQFAEYLVRVIYPAFQSTDFRLSCDDANLAALSAVSRLKTMLEGGSTSGIDFELPYLCPDTM
jgi:hypothetical protein